MVPYILRQRGRESQEVEVYGGGCAWCGRTNGGRHEVLHLFCVLEIEAVDPFFFVVVVVAVFISIDQPDRAADERRRDSQVARKLGSVDARRRQRSQSAGGRLVGRRRW